MPVLIALGIMGVMLNTKSLCVALASALITVIAIDRPPAVAQQAGNATKTAKYQIMPWGNSDTLVAIDNDTNEVFVLAQEYDEKNQYASPWRCTGKFNLDDAVSKPSTRYKPGMLSPHIGSKWGR